MPRIPDSFLDNTIYLYPSADAAKTGEQVGGTGFLVGWRTATPPPMLHVYAVTCAHVIADGSPVIRVNTKGGDWDVIERDSADWLQEPDGIDLAVCPIDFSYQHKYHVVGINDFVDETKIAKFAIGPGDDVFMAGRFVNHDGKQKNTPTLRFGNIAMMPGEPISGWQNIPQVSFLVDMRSRTAFSGSPVFVYIAPTEIRLGLRYWTSQQASTFYGPWLLGVDWGHIPIYEKVLGSERDQYGNRLPVNPDWDVKTISGMNTVTPAWKLLEFLMNDADLNEMRSKKHKEAARQPYAVPDVAFQEPEPLTTDESSQHREDFNRLLDAAVSGNKSSPEKS